MKQYLDLLRDILEHGQLRGDRTKTGTLSLFGPQMEFDLQEGFPATTTKKLLFRKVKTELLWFLRGGTNINWLHEHNNRIWDEWADEEGNLGPVYGAQWRSWPKPDGGTIDQIAGVIHGIKNHPESRRIMVSAWNVSDLDNMALPPCHVMFQFYVRHADDGPDFLDCKMFQRSADVFLGVPFNIASYSLLTHMMAQVCGLRPGRFIHTFGDVHIYSNHIDQVEEQVSREPGELPTLWLNPDIDDIDGFGPEDIRLLDYKHQGTIRAPIAVGGAGFVPTGSE